MALPVFLTAKGGGGLGKGGKENMKYRIKYSGTRGKWSGWRKTDKTEEEIKAMVGHPKIQAVEWKP